MRIAGSMGSCEAKETSAMFLPLKRANLNHSEVNSF
jgi:hypothetical protein